MEHPFNLQKSNRKRNERTKIRNGKKDRRSWEQISANTTTILKYIRNRSLLWRCWAAVEDLLPNAAEMYEPSSLSTSFWSLFTCFSACSARFSASFRRTVSVFISRLNSSTRWLAFSSDTSKDFREFPTTCQRRGVKTNIFGD